MRRVRPACGFRIWRPPRASCRSLGVAIVAVLISPAGSLASGGDVAATHRYLRANYAFVATATRNLGASHRALRKLLATVRRECPKAAAHSPQDEQSTQLSNEVIGAMVFAGGRPDLPAALSYVAAVRSLHWSDPRVNRPIHKYVSKLKKLTTIPQPALCYDVKAWAAGGFRTLPAPTVSFDALFYPNWVSAGILPRGLGAYEVGADRGLAKRTGRMEELIAEFEAREVETWGAIMDTMELSP